MSPHTNTPATVEIFGQQMPPAAPALTPLSKAHIAAIRAAGKADRLNFTDAIKRFTEYTDNQGTKSTRPDLAYANMTKTVYAAFSLNKAQREAIEVGLKPRDYFSLADLRYLQIAETTAAAILNEGMDAGVTRATIKETIRAECAVIAGIYRRLSEGVFKGGVQ